MRGALALIVTLVASSPAWALQVPSPVKDGDPRQCTVNYNEKEIVALSAPAGEGIAVRFGEGETVLAVNTSDSAHLKYSQAGKEASNIVYFKATEEMPAQPLSVRTIRPDGKPPRDYEFQWTALPDIYSHPQAQIASAAAAINITEATSQAALAKKPESCWQITFAYPDDAKAAQAAAWKAASAKRRSEEAEVELHRQQLMSCSAPAVELKPRTATALNERELSPRPNVKYVGMGDQFIAPYAICDDGMTTIMQFRGNIPTIFGVNANGTDRSVGFNVEDNGLVRIHEVPEPLSDSSGHALPVLRVRAGDLVYCIFNRAYAQNDPRTGTSVPGIIRTIGASK